MAISTDQFDSFTAEPVANSYLGCLLGQRLVIGKDRAHWERYVDGEPHYSMIQLSAHKEARWMEIDTVENGCKSQKRTMVTIPEEGVRALRDFCNAVLKESA